MSERQKSPPPTDRSNLIQGSETQPGQLDVAVKVLTRLQRYGRDIAGVVILAFSLMTLLALPGISGLTSGRFLTAWANLLRLWLGYGSIFVVIGGVIVGLVLLRKRENEPSKVRWSQVFSLEIAAFSTLILLALAGGPSLMQAEAGSWGGRIGWGLAEVLRLVFQSMGLSSVIWVYLFAGIIFLGSLFISLGFMRSLLPWLEKLTGPPYSTIGRASASEPTVSMAPFGEQVPPSAPGQGPQKKRIPLPAEFRKKFRVQPEDSESGPPPPRDERLPPLDFLVSEQSSRPDERNINLTAGLIEKSLADFGIPAKVVGFRVGPTVTQFAVEPGYLEKTGEEEDAVRQKVRVSQISALSRDLALALSAERLRIEAPVPGRPYVGIEVPNSRSSIVRLRPILETEAFYKVNSPLAIAMGRDVSGQPVIADLTSMPHMLIAGTTGSGKSVCIAALTTCLVMNNTPEDLRLVMIDPKMVELVRFNGLPHLYGKVETDLQRILGVLHWTVAEMDRRYRLLEEMHARHLDSYNRKVRRRRAGQPLPRIVVMIDELADLMMSAPEQTEPALVRLAQMARATGIHLVLATQRPSTDVVTGVIKANFPCRISFSVASSIDSRVILDTTGAESLLGHGDMLFLPPDVSGPVRLQGVMVTDQEVEKVITFWQQAHATPHDESAPWEKLLEEESVLSDRDHLLAKAVTIVRETRRASASLLQRRLRIGYPRAARLIDELEEMDIIGPALGGGREREVLIEPLEEETPERKRLDTDADFE